MDVMMKELKVNVDRGRENGGFRNYLYEVNKDWRQVECVLILIDSLT